MLPPRRPLPLSCSCCFSSLSPASAALAPPRFPRFAPFPATSRSECPAFIPWSTNQCSMPSVQCPFFLQTFFIELSSTCCCTALLALRHLCSSSSACLQKHAPLNLNRPPIMFSPSIALSACPSPLFAREIMAFHHVRHACKLDTNAAAPWLQAGWADAELACLTSSGVVGPTTCRLPHVIDVTAPWADSSRAAGAGREFHLEGQRPPAEGAQRIRAEVRDEVHRRLPCSASNLHSLPHTPPHRPALPAGASLPRRSTCALWNATGRPWASIAAAWWTRRGTSGTTSRIPPTSW